MSLLSLLQPWTKYAQQSPSFLIRLSFVIYSEELQRRWSIFFFWVFSQNFLDYTILSLKHSLFVSLLCMHTSSKSTSPFATTPNNISHNEPSFSSFSLSDYESIWYFFTESYSISDDTTLSDLSSPRELFFSEIFPWISGSIFHNRVWKDEQ